MYIITNPLYRLGFINANINDVLRLKQGLMPQNLASDCFSPKDWTNYTVPVNLAFMCNGRNMYPIKLPAVDYSSASFGFN